MEDKEQELGFEPFESDIITGDWIRDIEEDKLIPK